MIWLYVPSRRKTLLTASKEGVLQLLGKRRDGQARDHVVDAIDPAVGEDRRQVADVAFDDLEIRHVLKPLAQQAGEIGVALDHDNPAVRPGVPGDHPGDRSGAGPQLDQRIDCRPSRCCGPSSRDSQRLLGATLAIAVPCLRNLPRNSVKSFIGRG